MAKLSSERWLEISPYLDQALSLSGDERTTWLASIRAEKPELADLLQELLDEHRALNEKRFLEGSPIADRDQSSLAGQNIGAYKLISPIGQGGMGSVWLAERSDGRFERRVAVKFLRFAVAAQGGAERFQREGRILGQLADPHIAELMDAGVSPSGEPYLVLELVDGEQIDEYCDKHGLDVETRIHIFFDVLSAVAQAHTHLIVHRDLKPSNVLVRTDGQVKLLDFGIAKLLADEGNRAAQSQLTLEGGGALTPQFAAPEQVTGGAVTTATDMYALGVLLYLLLTGQHPGGAGAHSPADLIKAIVETEAPRASEAVRSPDARAAAEKRGTTPERLSRQLRGDLDTIVCKALKKNPTERYDSVTALAADLQRYLKHEPISARPDTIVYRATKFVRRNRLGVGLTAVALVAAIAGITGTLIQAQTARKQRNFAFRQLARAEKINDLNHFLLTDAQSGKPMTVDELLERAEHIVRRENYSQDPAHHVEMLVSIGSQYCDKGEYEKALPILQEAYQLSRGLQDPAARARASCALALPLDRRSEHARAESLIQEGLRELPNDPEFALDRASCLLNGSDVVGWTGDFRETLARGQSAERLVGNSSFASDYFKLNVLEELAIGYLGLGQVNKAIATYERASVLMTNLGYDDTKTAADLFIDWGNALIYAGRPFEAEKRFRRALDIGRTSQTENVVDPALLNQYADALRQLGRLDEALTYAQRGHARAQQTDNRMIEEQSLLKLVQIYREQHDLTRANARLAQLEPLMRRDYALGNNILAILDSEKSLLAQAEGDLPRALQLADQVVSSTEAAINAGRTGEGVLTLAPLLMRRSGTELEAGEIDKARADAERALTLFQAKSEPGAYSYYVGRTYLALGQALQAQGKTDEARAAFRSAAEQLEGAGGPDHPLARTAWQLAGHNSK